MYLYLFGEKSNNYPKGDYGYVNYNIDNYKPLAQANTVIVKLPKRLQVDSFCTNPNSQSNEKLLTFQKAQTFKEAELYAKNKLHIKNFDLKGDLELANWVNAGLTEIYNKYNGMAQMPSNIVKNTKENTPNLASYNHKTDTLTVAADNKKLVLAKLLKKMDLTQESNSGTISNWYKKALKNDFSLIKNISPEYQKKLILDIKKFKKDPTCFDYTDCKDLYNRIASLTEIYDDKIPKNSKGYIDPKTIPENNKFYVLYHEYGHFMHFKTASFSKLKSQKSEFLNSPIKQKIASEVSNYAKTEPSEFVAEVYAGMMNGKKYTNSVMQLYKIYNGPQIPK